jgi:glucokinase
MSSILAVDFGGTNIRVAHFDHPSIPPTKQIKKPTLASEGPEQVLQRLKDAIAELMPAQGEEVSIGIAAPGPLNPYEGIIHSAPNLPGWKNIPLRQQLTDEFGCPVFLGNDANLAALGEWRHGAGMDTEHMIYLTISTGIGGGIISHGRLLTGSRGLAAELGHMTILSDGPQCGCGQSGHIEAAAAGPAIARNATQRLEAGEDSTLQQAYAEGKAITPVEIAVAAKAGDQLSIDVLSRASRLIGHHLANLAHAFNPELFVLGGGISSIGELFFAPIRQSLEEHVMDPVYLDGLRVLPAALGDDAGLIGAMVLAHQA